jgi:hypothetical protein
VERARSAGVGHGLAIAAAIAAASALGRVAPPSVLRWIVAAALLAVGVDGLRRHRHVQLKGMRVSGPRARDMVVPDGERARRGSDVLPFVLGSAAPMIGGADASRGHVVARRVATP